MYKGGWGKESGGGFSYRLVMVERENGSDVQLANLSSAKGGGKVFPN